MVLLFQVARVEPGVGWLAGFGVRYLEGMAKRKPKPMVLTGPPVTQDEMAKILRLKKKDVARLNALVASIPGVHDSSEEIVKRYEAKAMAAGS